MNILDFQCKGPLNRRDRSRKEHSTKLIVTCNQSYWIDWSYHKIISISSVCFRLSLCLLNASPGLQFFPWLWFLYKSCTSVTGHFKHLGLRWSFHTIFQSEKFKVSRIYEDDICMVDTFGYYWRGLRGNKMVSRNLQWPCSIIELQKMKLWFIIMKMRGKENLFHNRKIFFVLGALPVSEWIPRSFLFLRELCHETKRILPVYQAAKNNQWLQKLL